MLCTNNNPQIYISTSSILQNRYEDEEGKKPSGNIKISMTLEVGSEFDWFRNAYQLQQSILKKERRFKKFLLSRSNAPKVALPFPLLFKVKSIALLDLIPVHLFTANSPYVQIEYGSDHFPETDVAQGAGSACKFLDMDLNLRW